MGVGITRQILGAWCRLGRMALVGGAIPLAGCTSWDELSSNSFWDDPVHVVFTDPDPIEILRSPESTGDQLARAMAELDEPISDGGSRAQQDEVIALLGRHATTDDRVLCRMAAIEALGRFRDPRAADYLLTAYHGAAPTRSAKPGDSEDGDTLRFTKLVGHSDVEDPSEKLFPDSDLDAMNPDDAANIRCRALAGLARHRSAKALPILINVVDGRERMSDSYDEVHQRELRMVAIRGLGRYSAERQAAAPLVTVLRNESDVAMRDAARDGLVKITGADHPTDADAWQAVVESPTPLRPRQDSDDVISQVSGWFGE